MRLVQQQLGSTEATAASQVRGHSCAVCVPLYCCLVHQGVCQERSSAVITLFTESVAVMAPFGDIVLQACHKGDAAASAPNVLLSRCCCADCTVHGSQGQS
jgi:hypothetical protein